ncbi:hypothetical protein AUK22_03845 [bacterium CG2_30_54_10]|nr:MAG: hypothetical protein AUK22_03845 [bacterium CG2_30_54_10]
MSVFRVNSRKTSGFILFVVLTIVLAMAILIFALSSHKSGAIEQLAKTIDQNRLVILAQSGNNEVLALIKHDVNNLDSPTIFAQFRSIFKDVPGALSGTKKYQIFPLPLGKSNGYSPTDTQGIANDAGYRVKIVSKADLVVCAGSQISDMRAFRGYLEVTSRAFHIDHPESLIEIKERRDVKMLDLRHFFDQYVFFLKNYFPDYNQPRKRLTLIGIDSGGSVLKGMYSRAYLGNRFYPANSEFPGTDKGRLWFDISYKEQEPLIASMLKLEGTGRVAFPNSPENYMYWVNAATFTDLTTNFGMSDFYAVESAKQVFEMIVNGAANGILRPRADFLRGDALKTKCNQAMTSGAVNSNAASFKICQDFALNAHGREYKDCDGFKKVLRTCFSKWVYHWGYTDAESIWLIYERDPSIAPHPKEWPKNLKYGGLATETSDYGGKGPIFSENLRDDYNVERTRIGIMGHFCDPSNKRFILFEGLAFLRFFKIGFFDEFITDFSVLTAGQITNPDASTTGPPQTVTVAPVPMDFHRSPPDTFQNLPIENILLKKTPQKGYLKKFMENVLMSRAVDSIPLNCLAGKSFQIPDPGGEKTFDPWADDPPAVPSASTNAKAGYKYFRCVDWSMLSRDYETGAEFIKDRVADSSSGEKMLYVDGMMLVRKGPLDLSAVHKFTGKGMIFVGEGDCVLGSLKKHVAGETGQNTLRIYLHNGDFEIRSTDSAVDIEASLTALTFIPKGSSADPDSLNNQGNLFCNGKNVHILGNLILDYLQLEWESRGLPLDGTLTVEHDPLIFNPESKANGKKQDPYRISLGEVKTLYSMNAGEKSF